jgi:hypothetical protein
MAVVGLRQMSEQRGQYKVFACVHQLPQNSVNDQQIEHGRPLAPSEGQWRRPQRASVAESSRMLEAPTRIKFIAAINEEME